MGKRKSIVAGAVTLESSFVAFVRFLNAHFLCLVTSSPRDFQRTTPISVQRDMCGVLQCQLKMLIKKKEISIYIPTEKWQLYHHMMSTL